MADEKKPKDKTSKVPKDKKRLDISAVAVIDNMVFSKTEAYAYYRITNEVFDFLSSGSKVKLGLQIANAFNGLMSERPEPLDCHLIITSVPVDVDAWAHQIRTVSKNWDQGPGFDQYVRDQIQYLKAEEYLKKVSYLGVSLGKRNALDASGSIFENGLRGAKEVLNNWLSTALSAPTESVSASEENDFRKKEERIHTTLSTGHLAVQRCSAEEILLMIKRQFYPNMPAPYLDVDHDNRLGPGDLDLELHSAIENKYRWMKFTQMLGDQEVVGYRACLSFTKFPKYQDFPNQGFPFFYFPSKMSLPFTCYSRFTLHPSKKMKAELEKKRLEQKDELENLTAGQDRFDSAVNGLPTDLSESLQDGQVMSELLAQDKAPWVEGSYRIVVETPTEELLRKYCSIIKQSYADLDINVTWTSGDQAALFLEQMPGDKMRMPAFNQLSNLTMLATSGFNFSSDVGDPIFGNDGQGVI
jgi:hypothetical protein